MSCVASPSKASLGAYPTPVERLGALSTDACELWVKRDDKTSALYGGNKVRKLEYVLADARAQGATRIVTLGAAGSHHVLATAIYGKRAGFDVDAIMVAQPRTDHVALNLRAAIANGVKIFPASTWAAVPFLVAQRVLAHDPADGRPYFLTAGGSNVAGSMGYVDAARELAAQVRAGTMPDPDLVIVTLGSGGTAAGLAAGLELEGMRARVVGVVVATPPWLVGRMARALARKCVRRAGGDVTRERIAERLEIDARYVGAGYGHATEEGGRAIAVGAEVGLTLDATYTAKAFAAALDYVRDARDGGARARDGEERRPKTILYFHTLSSAPPLPLLEGAPDEASIDADVRALLR